MRINRRLPHHGGVAVQAPHTEFRTLPALQEVVGRPHQRQRVLFLLLAVSGHIILIRCPPGYNNESEEATTILPEGGRTNVQSFAPNPARHGTQCIIIGAHGIMG